MQDQTQTFFYLFIVLGLSVFTHTIVRAMRAANKSSQNKI